MTLSATLGRVRQFKNDSGAIILPFFEVAFVFMRRDHVASFIANENHSAMWGRILQVIRRWNNAD
jgi:hypothetical protein